MPRSRSLVDATALAIVAVLIVAAGLVSADAMNRLRHPAAARTPAPANVAGATAGSVAGQGFARTAADPARVVPSAPAGAGRAARVEGIATLAVGQQGAKAPALVGGLPAGTVARSTLEPGLLALRTGPADRTGVPGPGPESTAPPAPVPVAPTRAAPASEGSGNDHGDGAGGRRTGDR